MKMIFKIICLTIIISLSISVNVYAQKNDPSTSSGQRMKFEHISLEQGLSQSSVFCMFQDSRGFMWFGADCNLLVVLDLRKAIKDLLFQTSNLLDCSHRI